MEELFDDQDEILYNLNTKTIPFDKATDQDPVRFYTLDPELENITTIVCLKKLAKTFIKVNRQINNFKIYKSLNDLQNDQEFDLDKLDKKEISQSYKR